ncbi:MAG: nicotinate (nicotinamide) nucleotide adenylyltransferase [Candidatus Cloacimonadales bacterium]|jgi:nicotinate-nucleotide adenylyltransferase|nr:nicotinate (nicotinamide) nucleotide adenylyltransferase [Candidatus Cloacimonadota bacterium]MDY0380707.1 nicotinate (nicotinamide) nucleotide adenylyltransferase [Candidatus Cloacimonadaceae bacterium]HCM14924.1 nicotinate (nicotinamide) nucleotide adenylyltransferase [Candidatus Cloacimonas sp.]MCB5256801.1 nicotinate (nicotinamide) nucleotide adenylyltransferase [Candidatus Cloacimonadota bacterium]MCB5263509.1 nicotinate (nicotinamide) nucleotide adenylyltransferase [Candidatus Cloacimo
MPYRVQLKGAYAILGGSFDPIHNGHLYLAKEVLSLSPVHKIILVPSFNHNFKGESIVLDYDHRLSLAQEAVDHFTPLNFTIQPAEDFRTPIEVWDAERGESGYTSDLVKKLVAMYPDQAFAFIIGADNLKKLPEWHDFEWLKQNLHFIILPRPDCAMPCDVLSQITHTILDMPLCPVSSSEIRARIAKAESIHDLVPEELEAKITQLYR